MKHLNKPTPPTHTPKNKQTKKNKKSEQQNTTKHVSVAVYCTTTLADVSICTTQRLC